MSDTPLTDAVTVGCHFGPFVEALADHARRMERQRDAARHALTQTLDVIESRGGSHPMDTARWRNAAGMDTANAHLSGGEAVRSK